MRLADRSYQGKVLSNSINSLDSRTNIRYYIVKGWLLMDFGFTGGYIYGRGRNEKRHYRYG